MWASQPSPATPAKPRPRRPAGQHVWLRLPLTLIVGVLFVGVLPSPWAFHIGGRFSALGEWDGYGPVHASNGGRYLLFTHLRGGVLAGHGYSGCGVGGCGSLYGSAQLCTRSGQHYEFTLDGAVHGWLSTNGALTDLNLTGGKPSGLPPGWVVAFHGVWHGPVLPVTDTDNSFTEVFTPAGAIRTTTSKADTGTAGGELRFGSLAGFDRACHALAGGPG